MLTLLTLRGAARTCMRTTLQWLWLLCCLCSRVLCLDAWLLRRAPCRALLLLTHVLLARDGALLQHVWLSYDWLFTRFFACNFLLCSQLFLCGLRPLTPLLATCCACPETRPPALSTTRGALACCRHMPRPSHWTYRASRAPVGQRASAGFCVLTAPANILYSLSLSA